MKKIFHILIITGFLLPSSAQTDLVWQVWGEMPNPVAGGEAIVIGGEIFIFGGYNDSLQNPVNWIQAYNPVNNSWRMAGTMSLPRYGHSAGLWQDSIYIFGGSDDSSDRRNSIELIPVNVSEPGRLAGFNTNFYRFFSSSKILNDRLHIFGGIEGERIDTLNKPYYFQYDFYADRIIYFDSVYSSSSLPAQQSVVEMDSKIYILGGAYNGISDKIVTFNPSSKEFDTLDIKLSVPRAGASAIKLNIDYYEAILLTGGYNESSSALESSDLIVYDTVLSLDTSLNVPRREAMMVLYEEEIYIFGGYDSEGNVVRTVEGIDLSPDVGNITENPAPNNYNLSQNYPNPFNPATNIKLTLPERTDVKLDIFSILGEHIKTLANGNFNAGNYNFKWDSLNKYGNSVPSGIYFYRLSTEKYSESRKMVLVK